MLLSRKTAKNWPDRLRLLALIEMERNEFINSNLVLRAS